MKLLIVFLLLTCTFPKYVFTQRPNIDSLKQLLVSAKEDTNRVRILNQITSFYLHASPANYEKALPVAQHASNLAEKLVYLTFKYK